MNKPFKVLKGNRVYLEMPEIPQSALYMDENVKQALLEREMENLDRLKVYAVGELVKDVNEGDVVLVDKQHLSQAPIITLTKDLKVLLVSPFNIIHIW